MFLLFSFAVGLDLYGVVEFMLGLILFVRFILGASGKIYKKY